MVKSSEYRKVTGNMKLNNRVMLLVNRILLRGNTKGITFSLKQLANILAKID